MSKTIKIDEKSYHKLNNYAGMLRMEKKRPVSMSDALSNLLSSKNKKDISSFANSWKMDEKEAKKIKRDIRKVWKKWKTK